MNKGMLELKERFLQEKCRAEKSSNILSNIRLIIFLLLIILIPFYITKHNNSYLFISSCLVFAFIVIIIIHSNIDKKINKNKYYLKLIKKYEDRCSDEWKKEVLNFVESDKDFVYDLNIVNNDSLLKYLNFTQSLGGKNNLIESLSLNNVKLEKNSIKEKQESISEISKKYEFLLNFQYILRKIDNINNIDYKNYFYFFDRKKIENKNSSYLLSFQFYQF